MYVSFVVLAIPKQIRSTIEFGGTGAEGCEKIFYIAVSFSPTNGLRWEYH